MNQNKEQLRLSNEESNRLTRECLQTALIYLLNEKSFDKITVTELVSRSGVSRMAFYRNYNTMEDILEEISNEVYTHLRDSLNNSFYIQNPKQWLIDFFTKAEENEQMISLLMRADLPIKTSYGESFLTQFVPYKDALSQYTLLALEGALSSIFRHWFISGRKESPEEIADICIRILTEDPDI